MRFKRLNKLAAIFRAAVDPGSQPKGAALPASFWIKFVQMSKRLGISPYDLAAVINRESAFSPGAQNFAAGKNKPPVAQGLSQFIKYTATKGLGMSPELWEHFAELTGEEQLGWVEKYFKGKAKGKSAGQLYLMNFGGYNNPDGSIYAGKEAQARWIAAHPDDAGKFKNPDYQQKAIEQNPGLVRDGKIMPKNVTDLVAGGVKSDIKARIDEAVQATAGQPVPSYEPPNPEWTGGVTTAPAAAPAVTPATQPAAAPMKKSPVEQEADALLGQLFA
jgi:hypothetical protein